jgi:hypothetical protein
MRRSSGTFASRGHAGLDGDRTFDRVDRAREFHQRAVAGELDDATAMLSDQRFGELGAMGFDPGKRIRLVSPHEPAVADHVQGEYCREPAIRTRSHDYLCQKIP